MHLVMIWLHATSPCPLIMCCEVFAALTWLNRHKSHRKKCRNNWRSDIDTPKYLMTCKSPAYNLTLICVLYCTTWYGNNNRWNNTAFKEVELLYMFKVKTNCVPIELVMISNINYEKNWYTLLLLENVDEHHPCWQNEHKLRRKYIYIDLLTDLLTDNTINHWASEYWKYLHKISLNKPLGIWRD